MKIILLALIMIVSQDVFADYSDIVSADGKLVWKLYRNTFSKAKQGRVIMVESTYDKSTSSIKTLYALTNRTCEWKVGNLYFGDNLEDLKNFKKWPNRLVNLEGSTMLDAVAQYLCAQ